MSATDETKAKHSGLIPWKPGQSGNPAGRPRGARAKLSEQFVQDILTDWETHGVKAIEDVRAKSPTDYLKVVASVITKDVAVTVRDYDDLSDAELAEQFAATAARLASRNALGRRDRAPSQDEGGEGTLLQ